MTLIAKKTGIAVGTLYNYYPNKRSLFLNILESSWNVTLQKIEIAENSSNDPKERLKMIIDILYKDIYSRKGLGNDIFTEFPEEISNVFQPIRERLNKTIKSLILNIDSEDINKRNYEIFEDTLLEYIFLLINKYPDDSDKCIEYLMEILIKVVL